MQILQNPLRHQGLNAGATLPDTAVSTDAGAVQQLLQHCPAAQTTPLLERDDLATELGVAKLYLKDERERMGLGSFKATGAAYVIARAAAVKINADPALSLACIKPEQLQQILNGQTYVCASAGNHGLSVAAGARVFGARAVIYLSDTVPEDFAERLSRYGAEVVRSGENYEASMAAAAAKAETAGWILLSDSSWPGYTELPTQVMEGYLIVAAEIAQQLGKSGQRPTHVLVQAGVGGIAAASIAYLRQQWGDDVQMIVVEPEAAPALFDSIQAGHAVITQGPVSDMGRLDCKEPSQVALQSLAREADWFITLNDERVLKTVGWLEQRQISTTSSAAAGLAVVQQSQPEDALRETLGINADSRILVILTEQA